LQLSTTRSTASFVLCRQTEKRIGTIESSGQTLLITWLLWFAPLLQALPPEAHIPAISKLYNNISDFSVFGNPTFSTVYRLLPFTSPLNRTPGTASVRACII